MLTAYDFPTAQLLDEAGIPLILVGDSLGQVDARLRDDGPASRWPRCSTTPQAVVRGTKRALVVGDMPFLSYSTPERRGRERGPVPARGRRPGGQGRGRRPQRADDRGARQGRHPGDGPHRLDAAGDQRRRQGPGPGQDAASRRGRSSPTRSRSRRPARSRSCSSSSRSSSRRRSPSACGSRRSASAPAPGAAARSRSSPTCSAGTTWHPKHARAVRGPPRDDPRGGSRLRGRRRGRHVPGPRARRSAWTTTSSTRSSAAAAIDRAGGRRSPAGDPARPRPLARRGLVRPSRSAPPGPFGPSRPLPTPHPQEGPRAPVPRTPPRADMLIPASQQ